jgi:hypothetical protein
MHESNVLVATNSVEPEMNPSCCTKPARSIKDSSATTDRQTMKSRVPVVHPSAAGKGMKLSPVWQIWVIASYWMIAGSVSERMEAGGWNDIVCRPRNGCRHDGSEDVMFMVDRRWCVMIGVVSEIILMKNNKRKSMRVTPSKYNRVIFSFMFLCDVADLLFFLWLYIDFLMWESMKKWLNIGQWHYLLFWEVRHYSLHSRWYRGSNTRCCVRRLLSDCASVTHVRSDNSEQNGYFKMAPNANK